MTVVRSITIPVPHFAVYDWNLPPSNPRSLQWPTRNPDGAWNFDSTFDITYKVVISFSTQPSHSVSGIGTTTPTA